MSHLPLQLIVGLLNSNLLDWYFRLGSTNSKVNEYQFKNLPCPVFTSNVRFQDKSLQKKILESLAAGDCEHVAKILPPALLVPPFGLEVQITIVEAVNLIVRIETDRGEISRRARAALDPRAQPYQDLIDKLVYAMAGLSTSEAQGLEERLAQML
jgi:hypothetical protein